MRNIYFMDQTKEFIEKDYDIVFLGNLFLKGKPYTNPKEAVDKEYVDNVFANIKTENLKGSKIEAKNFPAFNGDLINKAGQNNFQLKELPLKPGKYHRLIFDAEGRVTGGVEGNYIFKKGDIEKIDYTKIKKDDKTSIYDWTNGFDSSKYLMIDKDNIINKPLALKTKTLKTGHTVINETDIMTVSEKYFLGELGTLKRDGQHPSDNFFLPVNEYNVINARPDKFQFNFSPKITNPIKKEPSRTINIKDIGFYGTRVTKPITFVLADHLYICHNDTQDGEERYDFRIKLTKDGRLPEVINVERITFPHVPQTLQGDLSDSNHTRVYFIRNHIYITSTFRKVAGNRALRAEIKRNGSDVYFDERLIDTRDSDANLTYVDDKIIYIGTDGRLSWSSTLDDNLYVPQRSKNLPGNTTGSFSNAYNAGLIRFPIGSYIYMFYSQRSSSLNIPIGEYGNDLCYRIKYTNGTPYGEFETIKLGGILEDGLPEVITTGKYLIIFTLVVSPYMTGRGNLFAHYYEIQENGDIKFDRKELLFTDMLTNPYTVVLSKGSIFFSNWREVRELPFEGVGSSYINKV